MDTGFNWVHFILFWSAVLFAVWFGNRYSKPMPPPGIWDDYSRD